MNYRHQYHAGNFADVVKHALLVGLVRALQQKEKGVLYLDTHAGRGSYDLERASVGESLARTPEWPDGIGRLAGGTAAVLDDYLALVRQFNEQRGGGEAPRFYPGSPWILRLLARPQDRLAFCEKHPEEFAALRQDMAGAQRQEPAVSVQNLDGYVAIRALLPPPERRALVLIDPPYEAQDEYAQAAAAVKEGLRRLPNGVFALWYPLTQRARVNEFMTAILNLDPPPTLQAELAIAGDASDRKLKGCGLVVVNPPWKFDGHATVVLEALSPLLSQEAGAGPRVTWLVSET